MCLIGLALDAIPGYRLVVVANRDEFHERPTAEARWWPDEPTILGGRDELAGGTWLGVTRSGRLAAVTNVRDAAPSGATRSRGELVAEFLRRPDGPRDYAQAIVAARDEYKPFNLVLFADGELHHATHSGSSTRLPNGIHAISNAPVGEAWPKAARVRQGLADVATAGPPIEVLLGLLAERAEPHSPSDYRSDLFILGRHFGTRASTVVLISADNRLEFFERRFGPTGDTLGEAHFEIDIVA